MKTYLVVTLTCRDQPGIVDRVTEAISGHSANWEESRMAHLGGEFAGIIKIGVPEEEAEAVAGALWAMADDEMTVAVKYTKSDTPQPTVEHALYELRLEGADHEGIVHAVSHYLAGQGVNVETMDTELVRAPVCGTPLFHMVAQIKVPPQLPLPELNAGLDDIGHDLGVDIGVRPCHKVRG